MGIEVYMAHPAMKPQTKNKKRKTNKKQTNKRNKQTNKRTRITGVLFVTLEFFFAFFTQEFQFWYFC